MTRDEWNQLPKLRGVSNLKDIENTPIEVYGSIHPIATDLSKKWISQRDKYEKDTDFQEDLVAILMSAALSYATQEFHGPARLRGNPSDSAIDRIIVVTPKDNTKKNGFDGSTVQIVCTYGIELENRDVNDAIMRRVRYKHNKGVTYAKGIQLAVFVTQKNWKIKVDELIEEIKKEQLYSSYWVILPMLESGESRFVVNYLGLEKEERGQGQIVVDIKNGIKARFFGLYKQDGILDDVEEYVKYFQK